MKRYIVALCLTMVCLIAGLSTRVAADDGLAIGPLEYKTTLAAGEAKKGFIDVVNTSSKTIEIHVKVQAFRQIDDKGGLQFYDDQAISAGVKLDVTDVEIAPHAGAHIYFLLDGAKLPSGDVFAAILASTAGKDTTATVPAVQVGTLLLVENGTPPAHHAKVSNLQTSLFEIGDSITAKFSIQNTDSAKLTGFKPSIEVSTWPYGSKTIEGPLVFAGHSRQVAYTQPGNYLGPVLLKVKSGSSEQSQLLFVATGYWKWLAPLLVILALISVLTLKNYRHHKKRGSVWHL